MDGYDRSTGEIVEHEQAAVPARREPQEARNLIFASPQCELIFGALAVMQGEIEPPQRTKTAKVKGQTRNGSSYEYEYKYAPLEGIIAAIKEPMSKAKLVHRQFLAVRDGSHVMRTIIGHESGQWYGCDYPIFWDQARGMQGFASGVTYARRYGLMLALGIAAEDDDDANVADGNEAKIATPPPRQAAPPAQSRRAPPQRQQPQTLTPAQEEVHKRWRELRDDIDGAKNARDARSVIGCAAWRAWLDLSVLAYGTEDTISVETELKERANKRADQLGRDPADYLNA